MKLPRRKFLHLAAGAAALPSLSMGAWAKTPRLVTEETMVKSTDAGIEIYVRNKRPVDMRSFRPERTVVFVHG